MDGIQAILNVNGFGNVWLNPLGVNKNTFHKLFKQTLNYQFIQNLKETISSSNRFHLLHALTVDYSEYRRKKCVELNESCDVRNIFTRLRIDCLILESSQSKLNKSSDGICPNCEENVLESLTHFLLHCSKFASERKIVYDNLAQIDYHFVTMNDKNCMKYFLDLKCPRECINLCCTLVAGLYRTREKLSGD